MLFRAVGHRGGIAASVHDGFVFRGYFRFRLGSFERGKPYILLILLGHHFSGSAKP